MKAKEAREMQRLRNKIEVLEADRQRHMAGYAVTLHQVVEQEIALKDAADALEEALQIIRATLQRRANAA